MIFWFVSRTLKTPMPHDQFVNELMNEKNISKEEAEAVIDKLHKRGIIYKAPKGWGAAE